jgi:hypothetical protein
MREMSDTRDGRQRQHKRTPSSSSCRRSSRVLSSVMRRDPLTSLTPPALRESGGSAYKAQRSTNEDPNLQLVA